MKNRTCVVADDCVDLSIAETESKSQLVDHLRGNLHHSSKYEESFAMNEDFIFDVTLPGFNLRPQVERLSLPHGCLGDQFFSSFQSPELYAYVLRPLPTSILPDFFEALLSKQSMIIMLKNMKPTIRNDDFSTICFGAKSILISGNLSKSLSILQLSKELQDDNLIAAGGILYFLGRHRDESSCLILNVYARFYISAFL